MTELPSPFKIALNAYLTIKFYKIIDWVSRLLAALLMLGAGIAILYFSK